MRLLLFCFFLALLGAVHSQGCSSIDSKDECDNTIDLTNTQCMFCGGQCRAKSDCYCGANRDEEHCEKDLRGNDCYWINKRCVSEESCEFRTKVVKSFDKCQTNEIDGEGNRCYWCGKDDGCSSLPCSCGNIVEASCEYTSVLHSTCATENDVCVSIDCRNVIENDCKDSCIFIGGVCIPRNSYTELYENEVNHLCPAYLTQTFCEDNPNCVWCYGLCVESSEANGACACKSEDECENAGCTLVNDLCRSSKDLCTGSSCNNPGEYGKCNKVDNKCFIGGSCEIYTDFYQCTNALDRFGNRCRACIDKDDDSFSCTDAKSCTNCRELPPEECDGKEANDGKCAKSGDKCLLKGVESNSCEQIPIDLCNDSFDTDSYRCAICGNSCKRYGDCRCELHDINTCETASNASNIKCHYCDGCKPVTECLCSYYDEQNECTSNTDRGDKSKPCAFCLGLCLSDAECKTLISKTENDTKGISVGAFVGVIIALVLLGIAAVLVCVLFFYGHLECIGCVPEFDIIIEQDENDAENEEDIFQVSEDDEDGTTLSDLSKVGKENKEE